MPEVGRGPGVQGARGRQDWRREIRARLEPLRLAPERESEIVEEVAQHLDDRFGELMAMGRTEGDAAAEAWRELEAADVLRRGVSQVERPAPLDLPPPGAPSKGRLFTSLTSDIRLAFRTLRQNPSFSLPVLLAFALSVGPTTAILSLANWVMWKPVAGVQRSDDLGLVYFANWFEDGSVAPWGISYPNVADLAVASQALTGLAGVEESSATLVGDDGVPLPISTAAVTANFFELLGMRLSAGREFRREEDLPPRGAAVAIISEGFAQSAFGGPAEAIGRRITVNRTPLEVVGVAAPEFGGLFRLSRVQVWITGATAPVVSGLAESRISGTRARGLFSMFVVRRRPGHAWPSVEAELRQLTHQLAERFPQDNARLLSTKRGAVTPRLFPSLGEHPLRGKGPDTTMRLLFGVAAILLVLGGANVANLMVFRAVRRDREIAVRKALGASRARLVQWQLTESWLLALGGATLGLLLALALKQVLQQLLFSAPSGVDVSVPLDFRVVGLTLGVATFSGITAGLAPAWIASRGRLTAVLGTMGTRTATRARHLRSGLAIAQLSLSLTLLIGAVLLLSSVRNLRSVDLGFEPADLTTLNVDLSSHGYSESAALAFWRDLHTSVENGRRFSAVAVSSTAPFGGKSINRLRRPDAPSAEPLMIAGTSVSHEYFRTVSTPIIKGREFTADEAYAQRASNPTPVILNELLAIRLFGTIDVLGHALREASTNQSPDTDLRIIGVVRDSNWDTLRGNPEPFIYKPLGRLDRRILRATVLVRSPQPSPEVTAIVRESAARLDRSLPLTAGASMTAKIETAISRPKLFAWTFSVLGSLGFILAALGVYGLVAQSTAERTREFGIRIALGAGRSHIVGLVSRFAVTIAVAGTAGGIGLAYAGSRALVSMLFGISAVDARVYAAAAASLAVVVAVACVIPSLRAIRVQPVDVLRTE